MDPYQILSEHNIPYVKYEHPAVFTCEEAEEKASHVPGAHAKNLFLESDPPRLGEAGKTGLPAGKAGRFYLVTLTYGKRANLKHLADFLGEKKLHFGSPEKLMAHLGVTAGSVSPLGLINDTAHAVTYILDQDFLKSEDINMHPNDNTASLVIPVPDFLRLLSELGYSPKMYEAGSE